MMIRQLFHVKNFQLKEKNWLILNWIWKLKSVNKQENWALVVQKTFEINYDIGFGIPNEFPVERKELGWNWSINRKLGHVVQLIIWDKLISNFESLMYFQLKETREKNWLKLGHKQWNWTFEFRVLFEVNYNIGFGNFIKFPSQKNKNFEVGP